MIASSNTTTIKKITTTSGNKRQDSHKWVYNKDHIHNLIESLDCTHKDIADAFGVSQSAVSRWVKEEKYPRWTLLAVEGIVGENKENSNENKKENKNIFICSPKTKKSKKALLICTKAMGIDVVKLNLSNYA